MGTMSTLERLVIRRAREHTGSNGGPDPSFLLLRNSVGGSDSLSAIKKYLLCKIMSRIKRERKKLGLELDGISSAGYVLLS